MRCRAQRGFTLIEVLAAIALLSLAFAVLLSSLGNAARLASDADAHTRAALCAQSALDGSFVLSPIRPGTSQGRCDRRFHWQLRATPWRPPAQGRDTPQVDLFRLDLTVLWNDNGRRHHAEFSTLRAQSPGRGGAGSPP